MAVSIFQALGGLGFFLIGMTVMTDGLRKLAADRMSRVLLRFARSPVSGAASGAFVTALVQSSSATTVATVGFVSAGLLTFSQALGVMFGANIGTTLTGWLVAVGGFELELDLIMMPVMLAGVLLRMFGRGKSSDIGWAVAGFALLFLGIAQMKAGMAQFEGSVTPSDFPADTWSGRGLLVLIGAGVTVVTQSSSAGVAAALTAVDVGAISFGQAAALVIGMDVGTTSTTALATIGGSARTRRTGYSHVVYNVLTAVGAFLILVPYARVMENWLGAGFGRHAPLVLVGFHTTFNTIGVVAVLPFTHAFARLMTRLVPERGRSLVTGLDTAALEDASSATYALLASVRTMSAESLRCVCDVLGATPARRDLSESLREIDEAVDEARRFAAAIRTTSKESDSHARHVESMHCVDHLDRLIDRCRQGERIRVIAEEAHLRALGSELTAALADSVAVIDDPEQALPEERLALIRTGLRAERRSFRARTLERLAAGKLHAEAATQRLDAVRWLDRVAYHAWRIIYHLELARVTGSRKAPRSDDQPASH